MRANRIGLEPLVAILATAISSPLARAQVPEGFAVVCTHSDPTLTSGAPGLFLLPVPPLTGGPIAVTGLPYELSTNGGTAFGQGGYSVSIRSADRAVIVSTVAGARAPNGGQVALFVLHLDVNLNGQPATASVDPARTRRILLGSLGTWSADSTMRPPNVGQAVHRLLPHGRILVAAFDRVGPLPHGEMAGRVLAIVDTSVTPAAFARLRNPPIPSGPVVFGGIEVDPSGEFAYYLVSTPPFTAASIAELHRVELLPELTTGPGLAPDCVIATFAVGETACGIVRDDDGSVYVGSYRPDPTTPVYWVRRVRPDGCNPAAVATLVSESSNPLLAWCLDLDRASGCFVAGSYHGLPAPPPSNVLRHAVARIDPNNGVVTPPIWTSGSGVPGLQGVAVNNAMVSYGAPSPGQNRHWFENFPNPGGQPTLGNTGFTLTLRTDPGLPPPLLSALALSLGRGSTTVLGAEILVDPALAVLELVSPGTSVAHRLPIPNLPVLNGVVLSAQSLHLEATGNLAASRGLSLRVR